jgi:hypothetical protein
MKTNKLLSILVLATTAALASCGGGGDLGDGTQKLAASPSKIDLESPNCNSIKGPLVTLYGGIPPYRLRTPYPNYIQLDKDYVENAGDTFSFSVRGACLTTIPIFIYDTNGTVLEFLVSLKNNVTR